MATTLSCPSCQATLQPPVVSCPECGLPLTGPLAAALWQTDQQIGALRTRREELIQQLRYSVPQESARAATVSPAPAGIAPAAAEPLGGPQSWHGQQVLLALGALLVLVAAVVFLAVTWSAIGVAGQVSVMGIATALAAIASLGLVRRGLRATAEALAVLTVGLAIVDVTAAYQLNLAGLKSVDDVGYAAVAAVALALVFAGLAARDLRIYTFALAAVPMAAAAPLLGLNAVEAGVPLNALVLLLVATLFAVLRHLLPARWSMVQVPLLLASAGYLLLTWVIALPDVFTEDLVGDGGLGAAIALIAAAAAAWRSRLHRGLLPARTQPLLAASALIAAVLTVTGLAWQADATGVIGCVVVVLAAGTAGILAWRRLPLLTTPWGVLALAGQAVAATGLLAVQVSDQATFDEHTSSWAALTVALAATAAAALVTALRRPPLRVGAAGYAAVLAVFAAAVAAWPSGSLAVAGALTLAAVLMAAAAARLRGHTLEVVLAVLAACTALAAAAAAFDHGPRLLALVLAVVGLAALAYGVLPQRGHVALLGVACCAASTWTLLLDAEVTTVEAYSLPLAALIAVVGLVRLHRQPSAPSWLTLGPALSAALLPSALASIDDRALTRPLLVLAAGAVVLVVGVLVRWQSPVLVGSVSLAIVAVAQLAPYAVGLPRWLSFGTVGLLLLVLGARYEQRRRNAQQAARWVAALQ